MSKKRNCIFMILFIFLTSYFLVVTVKGHPPSSMSLSYDFNEQKLSVMITHIVSGDPNHYIENVVVEVDNSEIINQNYDDQPDDTFTYEYNVTANNGSTIQATATCSISGSITKSIVVGGTPSDGEIHGYEGILFILVISVVSLFILKRKKVTKRN